MTPPPKDLSVPLKSPRQAKSGKPAPNNLSAASRTRARKGEPKKRAVSIRLSEDVIDYFKAKGSGWQTRIDAALRAFVNASR